MKCIEFPLPKVINGETLDLPIILDRFVFVLTFWREKENLKLGLSLMRKMAPGQRIQRATVTDAECEALEKGMKLDGSQISPALNGYYMTCLGAVYEAKDIVDEEAPKPEAAPASALPAAAS